MKYGIYKVSKDKLEYEQFEPIEADINGEKIRVEADNPFYWTIKHYGEYELLK